MLHLHFITTSLILHGGQILQRDLMSWMCVDALAPKTRNSVVLHAHPISARNTVVRMCDDVLATNKASLLAALADGAALDDGSRATFDAIASDAPGVNGDLANSYWLGRYQLRSTDALAQAIQDAGCSKLVEAELLAAPDDVFLDVTNEGKDLAVRVAGAARITGSVQHGAIPGDDVGLLRATLETADDDGVAGAIAEAGKKAMTATMKPVFVDADMMLLRESGKPQGREPLELVLSRLPPESNEELKSGMELDDDYGA